MLSQARGGDPLHRCLLATLLLIVSSACAQAPQEPVSASEAIDRRAEIRRMGNDALERLHALRPETRQELARSVGFAAFDNVGVNLLVLSAAGGHGIAREIATGKLTYLKTGALGGGLGVGATDYRLVLIFHDGARFHDFLDRGLEVGVDTDLVAALGGKRDAGERSAPGVSVYQITDAGLVAEVMVQGTRYWKDPDLN